MRAQVNNDAHGWNSPAFAQYAESEPPDIDAIKGNYTHDDNEHSAALGYRMTVPISMANDYNGYIASYREFQRGDHYRKALTGWGPHSSRLHGDAAREARAAHEEPGARARRDDPRRADARRVPDPDADSPAFVAKTEADVAQNDVRATAIGEAATALVTAYEATLPDDGGEAEGRRASPSTCSASTSRRSSGSAGRTTPTTRTSACSGSRAGSGSTPRT